MKIKDTQIVTGGVFRCCLASIAEDLEKDCQVNDKHTCKHCRSMFVLDKNFIWIPSN